MLYPIGKKWIALIAYRIDIVWENKSDLGFALIWDLLGSICKNLTLIISRKESLLVVYDISVNKTSVLRELKHVKSILKPIIETKDFRFIRFTKLQSNELEDVFKINSSKLDKQQNKVGKKYVFLMTDLKIKGSMLPTMKTLLDYQCQLIFCSKEKSKHALFSIGCTTQFHDVEQNNKSVLDFLRLNNNLSGTISTHLISYLDCGILKWMCELTIPSVKHEINQTLINLIPDLTYHIKKLVIVNK